MTRRSIRTAALFVALGLVAASCSADEEASAGGQAEPTAGAWRTWVLTSPDEIAVPPPPAEGSAAEEAEDAELRDMADGRTTEIVDQVRKWASLGQPVSTPWVEMNLEFISARAKDPPLASRGYALVSTAVYDAVVATWHYKYLYDREAPSVVDHVVPPGPDPSYPSEHAAIAGAASTVLAYLFPERPKLRLDELADQAAESRLYAGVNRRSDVEAGLELGRQVAEKVIAYAQADRAEDPCNARRPGPAGRYWDPPPGSVANPVQPCAGQWKPWVLTSGDQFRPGPPPVLGSPEFRAQAEEIVAVKAALTDEQKRIATFWAGGEGTPLPPGVWINVVLAYLRDRQPTEPQAERVLAMVNVAQSDAGIAAWDTKYTYWDPRPENGVRDIGLDPSWSPYIETPFFPSYISGHATYSAAAAEVLAHLFPSDAAEFHRKAEEASNSRLWGGIHWRLDNEVGMDVGRQVGALVVQRATTDGAPPMR
ncbi:MAG: vanadium-dependent haloperoxidase [Actinomycetota bacterium]